MNGSRQDVCGFFNPLTEVEGYAEAVAREGEGFDAAWLGLPEIVAGIQCQPVSCYHLLWLELVSSPFLLKLSAEDLVFKPDIIEDVGRFFWIVSDGFEPLALDRKAAYIATALKKLCAVAVKNPDAGWLPHLREILSFVESAFNCAPKGKSGDGKRYYSYAASIADFYGTNYHLSPQQSIRQPLATTWQLMRCRRRAVDSKYSPALDSETLLSEYLEKINSSN